MSPDLKAFQSGLIHEAIDGSNLVRGPRGGARDLLLPRGQETASQNAQVRDEGTAAFIMPRHLLIWHMGWSEWWRACSLERRHDGLFQSNRGIKSQ